MRKLLFLTLLAAAVLAQRGPRWHELEGYTFKTYMRDFGRAYKEGTQEYMYREELFNNRMVDIRRHNADPTLSWKRGVNQFSDWTETEWKNYNSLHASKSSVKNMKSFHATRDSSTLPRTVDYRIAEPRMITAVKNQGHCGNCWAHSATETLESAFAWQFGQLPVLSTQQITSCTAPIPAFQGCCFGCGGGIYLSGWIYVQASEGLFEEWLYPFTDFFAKADTQNDTSKCLNISSRYLKNFAWVPKANVSDMGVIGPNNANDLLEALVTMGPQSIAVSAGTWMDYEGGILHNNYTNNNSWTQIDHAVQVVGYGHDDGLHQDYWIVRNSWGTNWGEEGFIRLYRPAVEPCSGTGENEICGTSGILYLPAYVTASKLKAQNP